MSKKPSKKKKNNLGKKTRKKKKNNPEKRYAAFAKALFKDVAAARLQSQITDKGNTSLFSISDAKPIPINRELLMGLTTVRYKWSVFIAVFCRDQFGKDYMQGQWVVPKEPYYHHHLIDEVAGYLDELVEGANKQHIVDIGWLSVLNGKEIEHEKVENIFVKYGCFDGLAQWQLRKLEGEVA